MIKKNVPLPIHVAGSGMSEYIDFVIETEPYHRSFNYK